MLAHGYTHRGEPSISSLARAAGLSVETTRRFIHHQGEPAPGTVVALTEALGEDMSWWAGLRTSGDVYVGPDQSRYLDQRQRLAITELINAFVRSSLVGRVAVDDEAAGVEIRSHERHYR